MAPNVRRWFANRFVLALGLVALLGTLLPVAPVAAATDRVPDLRVAYIKDLRIVRSDGRRLLRFTGTMYNTGAGPLDIRAHRNSRQSPWDVDQIIYNSDGGSRRVQTAADMKYAGDGANEAYINRIAEAGLTHGCDPGKYCPAKRTTQGQVARLLGLARALPPATQDYYDDDNGTTFEDDLNRLAEAGISSGCGQRLSCPKKAVTRGQLVAMLHRALAAPVP